MGHGRSPLVGSLSLGVALAGLLVLPAHAQEGSGASLREQYLLEVPQLSSVEQELASQAARTPPGSNAGSPSAFGPNWGNFFAGTGMQNRIRYYHGDTFRDNVDGSLSVGFGLGDAQRYLGLEVAYTSLGTFDSGFGKRATVSLKLHRLLPGNTGVAVGWENAMQIGLNDAGESFYAVGTKVFQLAPSAHDLFNTLTVSAGVGNGRFRFEEDMLADRKAVNAFASVGLRVAEPVSVIADWTGQDLSLATSLVPFRSLPLAITAGLVDVTGTAGDGARLTLGAGMGFSASSLLR